MCILCDPARTDKVQSLTHLNVSGCKALKTIPVLPNLIELYCSKCPGLTAIPVLPNLTVLNCFDCPGLTAIPVLPNLAELDCFDCPGLTAIPVLPNLTKLNYSDCRCLTSQPNAPAYVHDTGCPWLEPLLSHNLTSLFRLQRWARNLRLLRFVRLTSSRTFNEHFFAPTQQGGRWHKRHMEQSFEPNKRMHHNHHDHPQEDKGQDEPQHLVVGHPDTHASQAHRSRTLPGCTPH